MNRTHFFFLFVAAVLAYAAYEHAGSVEASIADAAVDAAARKVGLDDSDCKAIGNAGRAGAAFVNGGLEKLHVSAPAAVADSSAEHAKLCSDLEALGNDHDALMARVAALESRKVCTCQHQAAKVEAPPVLVETQSFSGCANGQCGVSGGRGLFGRRR